MFAGREAPLFLADLAPEGFLLEILQLQFVEDTPNLNAERGLGVVAVQPVGDRDHVDAGELQFCEDREHQVVVAGQPRQIVDEHDLEEVALGGGQ
jgi:hypothetical protein